MIRALFRHAVEIVSFRLQGRDSQWPKVRAAWIELHPKCAACGGSANLNVHHIKPFHVRPDLELDADNLITLCEDKRCHFIWGHLNTSWQTFNKAVRNDTAAWLKKVKAAKMPAKIADTNTPPA